MRTLPPAPLPAAAPVAGNMGAESLVDSRWAKPALEIPRL